MFKHSSELHRYLFIIFFLACFVHFQAQQTGQNQTSSQSRVVSQHTSSQSQSVPSQAVLQENTPQMSGYDVPDPKAQSRSTLNNRARSFMQGIQNISAQTTALQGIKYLIINQT